MDLLCIIKSKYYVPGLFFFFSDLNTNYIQKQRKYAKCRFEAMICSYSEPEFINLDDHVFENTGTDLLPK